MATVITHENYGLFVHSEVKRVAVLTSCLDETGTHDGARVTSVGGYLFDKGGQERFTQEWAKVLQPLRAKGIRYFHAAECNAPNGPFMNLSSAERLALFGDLIELIRQTATFGMVTAIEDRVFGEVMKRNKVQQWTGSKYTACTLRNLYTLKFWADEQKFDGEIAYRFEAGNQHQDEANHMMEQIAANPELSIRFRYGGHVFEPKQTLLPLQAADLWAWLWQKNYGRKKVDSFVKSLFRNPGRIPHYVIEVTDVSLNMLAMENMFHGVKSNRKYETQDGKVRIYRV